MSGLKLIYDYVTRDKSLKQIVKRIFFLPFKIIRRIVIDILHSLGFLNIYRSTIYGPPERVHLGRNVGHGNNAFYNTRSGNIHIGDDTVISFNCMFLTGIHEFKNGKLKQPKQNQVPEEGYDIQIGCGCWIASGSIILGGVTIGDNCIVAAGAVVTKNFPSGSILGGVPAKIIGRVHEMGQKSLVES
jgi:acetyltransferase-like isoleucine patch superfamily enzyme